MAFKRLEGETAKGNPRTLFRGLALNQEQFKLVQEIIAHHNGETKLTRKQCRDAHGVLRGKKACPYFISKNVAVKMKERGMYDLGRLKLSAEAAKATVATEETAAPKSTPKKKAAKKGKGKKESAPKIEAPAETPATMETEPATV